MTRKAILAIFSWACALTVAAQSRYATVEGVLQNIGGVKTVQVRSTTLHPLSAPIPVDAGHYSFRLKLEGPTLVLLTFTGEQPLARQNGVDDRVYNVPVVLQPGPIELLSRDSVGATTVAGSPAHDDYQRLQAAARPFEQKLMLLRSQYADSTVQRDERRLFSLARRIDSTNAVYREEVLGKFLSRHISSPLAPWILRLYWQSEAEPDRVLGFLMNMPGKLRNGLYLRGLRDAVEGAAPTAVGQDAPALALPDTSGQTVTLESFRGRWVLLHFWGSWHQASRDANREIAALLRRYSKANLAAIGVAVERQKSDRKIWMRIIHDEELQWTHLADFKLWDSRVIKRYGRPSLPLLLLIDPNGRIVGRNLRGERLLAKLDEVLGNVQ